MWYEMDEEWVIFSIKAQPGSSKNRFAQILDDALKVNIKAPAVEGAANKELVKFLAKSFKVPKSSVEFLSGETSKKKRIRLPRNEKVEAFIKEMDER